MSDNGALRLLSGEPQGFAIDATTEGGSIAIRDTTTKANNHIINGVTNLIRNGLDSFNPVRAGSAKLVQSGTSPKVCHFAESPYVRFSPHNLQLNSQDISTGWNLGSPVGTVAANAIAAPDGTMTADKFTCGSAGDGIRNSSAITTIAGMIYTWSSYVKYSGTQWVRLAALDSSFSSAIDAFFDVQNGVTGSTTGTLSSAITSAGNGWYRCSFTFTNTNTLAYFYTVISASSSGGGQVGGAVYYTWGNTFNRGYNLLPYIPTTSAAVIGIPQSYDAAAEQYGILVEPAATNATLRSDDFGHASWASNLNITVTSNSVTAPDGSTTADTITDNSTNARHMVGQQSVNMGSNTVTGSCYMKAGTSIYGSITLDSSGQRYGVLWNLSTGTFISEQVDGTSPTSTSNSIVAVGGGWYRCSVTSNNGNDDPYLVIGISNSASPSFGNATPSYSGSGQNIYIWGAQCELGSVATSYIPTLGSTVTRAEDVIRLPVTTIPFSTTVGSVWHSEKFNPLGANTCAWSFQRDTDVAWILFYHGGSGGNSIFNVYSDAGVEQVGIDLGAATNATLQKYAFSWAANDFAAVRDGGTVGVDTAGTIPTTVNYMGIGIRYGGLPGFGWLYQITYVPRTLSDAELQAKST